MGNQCPFSNRYFTLPTEEKLPVECPECGAVRTTRYSGEYPQHQTLTTSTPLRKRWKRIDGSWQIVEAKS